MGSQRALLACALALAACGGGDKAAAPAASAPETIQLTSPVFEDGKPIPKVNSCDGAGGAPTLVWSDVPESATELVLTVYDTDASFTHWSFYGLPVTGGRAIVEDGKLPAGVLQGANSAGKDGWTPPCPPKGDGPHHYVFTLYALDRASGLRPGAKLNAVNAAVKGAVAQGRLTGTYSR